MGATRPREIFTDALQIEDPQRRSTYLDEACGDNHHLRRHVEQLLAQHKRQTPFFLDDASLDSDSRLGADLLEQPGDTIGPYRLESLLGEGGMGVVFVARQSEPVKRRVALKVVKPGMDSRQVVARFEAERQALALMSHPNIAQVYDGGMTSQGRPYFVMELVQGVPITDYCDAQQLSIDRRLELMIVVCQAVQHAHQKGVIHRDLKPANILVEEKEGVATPKVIDFGVAKALDQSLSSETVYTAHSQVVGTPYYMSPEQARGGQARLDTTSDVYSLGVILYELLTGTRPFDETSLVATGTDDLRELICQHDPPRPSQRVKTLTDETSATVARYRRSQPQRLPESLRGELDWIVLKALEKDPRRRYQSARDLADDLRRRQANLPVLACPPTAAYRMSKVIRRYRTLLATIALVAAALVVGLAAALWQAHRARVAERQAEANYLAAAESSRSLARALYSTDMLSATQLHYRGEFQAVREVLDRYRPGASGSDVLRGYEWYLLDRLQATPVDQLYKTPGAIRALEVAPPGGEVAVGDSHGKISLIDLANGRVTARCTTEHGEVQDLCYLGRDRLAACGNDGAVTLWKIEPTSNGQSITQTRRIAVSGKPLIALTYSSEAECLWTAGDDKTPYRIPLSGRHAPIAGQPFGKHYIVALAAVPDGGLLAGDYGGFVAYYPPDALEPAWTLDQSAGHAVAQIVPSVESQQWLMGQLSGWMTWFAQREPPRVLFAHLLPADVHAVGLSRDARWAAAGDSGGRIHLLPIEDVGQSVFLQTENARRRRLRSWKVHQAKVERVQLVTVGDPSVGVLSAARDGTLCLSRPLAQPATFVVPSEGVSAWTLLNDSRILLADEGLSLRRLEPKLPVVDELAMPVEQPGIAAASQSGRYYFLDNNRRLYEIPDHGDRIAPREAWTVRWEAARGELAPNFAVSPDGRRWAADVRTETSRRYRYEIYRTGDSKPLATFPGHSAPDIAFSPDSQWLAIVQENDVVLHDAATGKRLATLTGHGDTIQGLAFAPDSRSLASVSHDRTVICWDTAQATPLWSSIAHENRATAVAYHPNLPTLATTGEDGMVRFWRTAPDSVKEAARLVGEFPLDRGRPKGMAFSADGASLVIRHRGGDISVLQATLPSR